MKVSPACTLLLVVPLWMMASAHAQFSHIEFGAGGGFSVPQGQMGNNVDTGWNFVVRGDYKTSTQWDLNRTALNRFGEPGGYSAKRATGECLPLTALISRSCLSRSVCAGNPPPETTRVLASAGIRVAPSSSIAVLSGRRGRIL